MPWVTVALSAAVCRAAANLSLCGSHKNAKHFHHPLPFKETDGRPEWSQSEFGEAKHFTVERQPCLQRKTAASVIFTVFILWNRLESEKHPASARSGSVLSLVGVSQKVLQL